MPGNTWGELFRVTTCGESHGGSVAAIIDGCPPGLPLDESDIQRELDRRRPGQSSITTERQEEDTISIESGVFEGVTTGTPILLVAKNRDARSSDYDELREVFRPSHADFTYEMRFGIRDHRGGGRSSARETLARVAAGAVAQKYLRLNYGIEIVAYVQSVKDIVATITASDVTREQIERTPIRCPDDRAAAQMIELIEATKVLGDSVGGIVACIVRNVPPGLGEPVFDKLHAELAKAVMSINAVKGFEIGSGFQGTTELGSEHNDEFTTDDSGSIRQRTNRAGGVLGGISSGEDIYFRAAFKPTSTIRKTQSTVTRDGTPCSLSPTGRHDPCVLPRAVPIVEAMTALVLTDHVLRLVAIRGGKIE